MYFGGYNYKTNKWSDDIWFYDIDNNISNNKWKLYPLCLAIKDDPDYNVIHYGDFIFIFYTNSSRKIFIYNLLKVETWSCSKEFPSPYKGKAICIKTSNNFIHFINGENDLNKYECIDRPFHFRMNLNELIPNEWRLFHQNRYKMVQFNYIYHHINQIENANYNRGLSLLLLRYVDKFYPVFM